MWEFRKVPAKFWSSVQNQRSFVLWVSKKEGIDPYTKSGLRKLTANVIQNYGGSKALLYAGGMFELLNTVTPGKYKKWEICKVTSWTSEDIIIATRWLIEEKLQYTPEQVCGLKITDFRRNNLDGMLQKGCNHSILTALNLAYPNCYYRTRSRGICYKQ